MRVVFMGTPPFALETLKALCKSEHKVVAVVTKQDKPVGRKKILTPPVVKVFSLQNNIEVLQPESIRTKEVFDWIKNLSPDVIVVAAYGKIIPPDILSLPKYGCINVHASLLPKLRGAAPIAWSIVRGETLSGITIMKMDEGLDTGGILLQEETKISENETAEELYARLSLIGANLLVESLDKLSKGGLKEKKQDESKATMAPIIKKEFSLINWNRPSGEIHNLVRGFVPWPCARTTLDGKCLKILETKKTSLKSNLSAGCVESFDPFLVSCKEGECLEILRLQLEGKRAMSAKDFVLGNLKKQSRLGV